MSDESAPEKQQMLSQILNQLRSALAQLDGAGVSAHIGAHLDLAIHQLGELINKGEPGSSVLSDGEERGAPLVH